MTRFAQDAPPRLVAARWASMVLIWLLDHWLALLLTGLALFVTLPFLAPVLMALGWSEAGQQIYTFYLPFCHQLPQRSWFFFGAKFTYTLDEISQVYPYTDPSRIRFFYGTPEMGWRVAWSDRMVSFYMMAPVFGLLYAWRRRASGRIRPISLWLLIAALLPLALDGGTHLVSDIFYGVSNGGFRDTNAWLAWLTYNAWPNFYAGDHFGAFNWWMRLLTGPPAAWGIVFYVFPIIDDAIKDR